MKASNSGCLFQCIKLKSKEDFRYERVLEPVSVSFHRCRRVAWLLPRLLLALVLFAVADYITGVMCAVADKKLSSEVGFKGICRKVIIFMLVGIAHIIDVNVIATGSVLRTAVIFFYLSNEGVSLLENAGHLGLPIPEKLKVVLEQLHDRSEKSDE